jgi:hypothetical protein
MVDILSIVWKEFRELLIQKPNLRGGWFGLLVFIGVFGVMLPLQSGQAWVESPIGILYWIWVPFMMVSTMIADSFAGERERHTLETLLASRLTDTSILLGKIFAALTYGWGDDACQPAAWPGDSQSSPRSGKTVAILARCRSHYPGNQFLDGSPCLNAWCTAVTARPQRTQRPANPGNRGPATSAAGDHHPDVAVFLYRASGSLGHGKGSHGADSPCDDVYAGA